jgi:hypothetical protein
MRNYLEFFAPQSQRRLATRLGVKEPLMHSKKNLFDLSVRYAAVLGLAFMVTSVPARGHTIRPPVNLSNNSPRHSFPVMARDAKGHIDVAWSKQRPDALFFTHSADGGATFFSPVEVQGPLQDFPIHDLQIGVDAAGDINLLWWHLDEHSEFVEIFFSRSTDGGFTFSASKNLSTNFVGTGAVGGSTALFVDPSGNIEVGAFTTANGAATLFFIHSTDGGVNFSAPVKVWTSPSQAFGSGIELHAAVGSQGQVYAFWTSDLNSGAHCDILFSRSLDGGETFSSALHISRTPVACFEPSTPLVDARGHVNVAWIADDESVSFSRSTDEGASFSHPKNVSGTLQQNALVTNEQLAVDPSGEISIVWRGISADRQTSTVLFARSDDGRRFSTPLILSLPLLPNFFQNAGRPVIGVDRHGHISVAWGDNNQSDIFFRRSTDEGATFSNPVNLSNMAVTVEVSQIIVDSHGNADVLWRGVEDTTFDVFFDRVPFSASLADDFTMKVSPKSKTVFQGEATHLEVTAYAVGSHHDTVTLGCSYLPVSATCTFNPPSVTLHHSGVTATLTLTVPADTVPGTYLFTVDGVGGSTIDTQTVELTVKAPGD